MAELILKVGSTANYQDGDILCAFNRRYIRCCHAQMLCHVKHSGFNSDGLRPISALSRDYYEATHEYRFERISQYEIERIKISTGIRERLTGPEYDISINAGPIQHITYPEIRLHNQYGKLRHSYVALLIGVEKLGYKNVSIMGKILLINNISTSYQVVRTNSEFIDVERFLKHRTFSDRHRIFGTHKSELWYGGIIDHSNPALDTVWSAIETKTSRQESEKEFQFASLGRLDIRHHLGVRWREFTDAEAQQFVTPKLQKDRNGELVFDQDGQPILSAKREKRIDWRTDLLDDIQITESQVVDRNFPVGQEIPRGDGTFRYIIKDQPIQMNDSRIKQRASI